MFYKASKGSTVLDKPRTVRNDHENINEEEVFAAMLVGKVQPPAPAKTNKLSTFEKELLAAWKED